MPVMRGETVYFSNLYAVSILRWVGAWLRRTSHSSDREPISIHRRSGLSLDPGGYGAHDLPAIRLSSSHNFLLL